MKTYKIKYPKPLSFSDRIEKRWEVLFDQDFQCSICQSTLKHYTWKAYGWNYDGTTYRFYPTENPVIAVCRCCVATIKNYK